MAATQLSQLNPDGTKLGQSATDKVGFFGTTPAVKTAVTCVATGCVVATVLSKLNTLIVQLQTYGLV